MSKSIRSYPIKEQAKVIARRVASNSKGLGYWAAIDALVKISKSNRR